jgi:UDP-glucose:(heptosyl)LPS alpha-1,3-glucosyltransferase
MKLGLVYHQLVPAGGLENYLIEFSRRLSAAGHELTFVTSKINQEVAKKITGEVRMLPRVRVSPLLRMWQFSRQAARVVDELEVESVLGFGRTVRQDVHRAGGGCHALYSRLLPVWKRYGLKNLLELRLERQLYAGGQTGQFVTNSRQVAVELQRQYGVDAGRFTTIHTAVEGRLFCPAEQPEAVRREVRGQMKTGEDEAVFLFVSLSHRRKGLDSLLEALAKVEKGVLWVVGKPLGRRYLEQVKRLGIGHRLRLVQTTGQLVKLYQAADWFVHPTRYDACANTVLQSMACGLPGLISVHDGAVDHVADGVNGLLLKEPGDAEALAAVMRRVLTMERAEQAALGQAAHQAMQALTWDGHVAQWEALLGS